MKEETPKNIYSIGFSPATLQVLSARTAIKHASYLLPYLDPSMKLLDCGCGPGNITRDFAKILKKGFVIGIDREGSQIDLSLRLAVKEALTNLSFQEADVYNLPFLENTFDVVHAHALLCQLKKPMDAILEMKRVLKPNGVIAIREPDFDGHLIYAHNPLIAKAIQLALKSMSLLGGDYFIGKKLRSLFHQANFHRTMASASCDTHLT